MSSINVFVSIGVLALLIFFHEAGHFIAAKSQGILVSGFSIGFGPSLIKKEYKGVTYSIRAIPLGGFVSFPDDDEASGFSPADPNLLKNRPIFQRLIVISAGVIANLFIAWLVLFFQATFIGIPDKPEQGVLIINVQENEAADVAGLSRGDKILSINGKELGFGQKAVENLVEGIKASPDLSIKLEKESNDIKSIIEIIPKNDLGVGKVGAQLQQNIISNSIKKSSLIDSFDHSNYQFSDLLIRTIKGYQGLFTNFASTSKQLSGPVKIVELGAQLSEQGISGISLFAALVSINLAVLNSLPLPLLDGGQFSLILIEAIRRKPIPQKIQYAFMQSGFLLLVGLSIVLIIRDTSQLAIFKQLANR